MGGISLNYLLRRLLVFFLTLWVAATLIFIIPRLAPGDPISAMVARLSYQAGFVENADLIIEGWKERFGLNDPVYVQYVRYLGNLLRFDMGYAMARFPSEVSQLVGRALPWTIGLVGFATLIFFTVGNLFGALLAWTEDAQAGQGIDPDVDDLHIDTAIAGRSAARLHIWLLAKDLPAGLRLWL